MAMRLAISDGTPALLTDKSFKQTGQIASKLVNEMMKEYKASHVALMQPHNHWDVSSNHNYKKLVKAAPCSIA